MHHGFPANYPIPQTRKSIRGRVEPAAVLVQTTCEPINSQSELYSQFHGLKDIVTTFADARSVLQPRMSPRHRKAENGNFRVSFSMVRSITLSNVGCVLFCQATHSVWVLNSSQEKKSGSHHTTRSLEDQGVLSPLGLVTSKPNLKLLHVLHVVGCIVRSKVVGNDFCWMSPRLQVDIVIIEPGHILQHFLGEIYGNM